MPREEDRDARVRQCSNAPVAAEWFRLGQLPVFVAIGAFWIAFDGANIWMRSRHGSSVVAEREAA